jgi:hypothetical protein
MEWMIFLYPEGYVFVLPLTIQSSGGGGFVYICIAVDDPVIKRGGVCLYLYCH